MPASSSGVVVRMAGAEDVAALAELRALWGDEATDPALEAQLGAWIEAEGDRRTTWLALEGDRAVGMGSMFEYRRMPGRGRSDSRWGYISNMFVRPEARNRGVGSALLGRMIEVAEERGYVRLVLSPSARAVPFYRRAGFVVPDAEAQDDRLLVRPMR